MNIKEHIFEADSDKLGDLSIGTSLPDEPKKAKETVLTKPIQFKVKSGGNIFSVSFEANKNPTKQGVKLKFTPERELNDNEINDAVNKLALLLQKRFSNYDIQVDRDVNPVSPKDISFIVPLNSIGSFIMNKVIKNK